MLGAAVVIADDTQRVEHGVSTLGSETARVAGILLVDSVGRLLLQLRDRDAPTHPGEWSILGGHIESGETPEEAAHREIREESGLIIASPLAFFLHEVVPRDPPAPGMIERFIFCAPTAATQDEIVCGEGEAIVFVAPEDIGALDLVVSARRIVQAFIGSGQYAALAAARPERRMDTSGDDEGPYRAI